MAEQMQVMEKYLTFRLMDEDYGVDILSVKEIIGMLPITPVPRSKEYLKGVINLRGKIIPVVDLRVKMGMPAAEIERESCIITLEIDGQGERLVVGFLIDAVSEVLEVAEGSLEPLPTLGAKVSAEFVRGLAKTKETVCILLRVDRLLVDEEKQELKETAGGDGK